MKSGFLLLTGLLLSALTLPVRAQQPEEGWANHGEWKFELRANANEEKEIWIIPEANPAGARKMTTTGGWGNLRVHISPDDKTIVVEDGGGSLGIDLRVFRSTGNATVFIEDETVKIADIVEAWAVKKLKAPTGVILGHRYVKAHGWSSDGAKLLVSIAGSEGELEVPGWFAIYDLESGTLSFDLSTLNH
ncbi:MAG TPA: hypothetical protein PK529_01770 [Verrucomicrobiales bacterium]|nr:hypothetical protein [Verrucomicrobiales bacterium]